MYASPVMRRTSSRSQPRASMAARETARARVAAAIGAPRDAVYWTSGATESNNLALLGAAEALRERGDHLVTTSVEHHAVLDAARALEGRGFAVTYLRPDRSGLV